MKQSNVIDMTAYFIREQQKTERKNSFSAGTLFHILGRVLETSAAIVTALCICVCTLLFFTML